MTGLFRPDRSRTVSSNEAEDYIVNGKKGRTFGEIHITIVELPDNEGNYFLECRTQIFNLAPSEALNKYKDDPRILALKKYYKETLKPWEYLKPKPEPHPFLGSD